MTGWWGGWDADATARQAVTLGASQEPWELARALELVRSVSPRTVVEIGCDRGGTLYAWCETGARVYGITLADNGAATGGSGLALENHGAFVLIGDSHDPHMPTALRSVMEGEPLDVLVIDGDHAAAGVRADLAAYGPLVEPGGLILLHDITSVPDGLRPVEVSQVWAEIRDRYVTGEIRHPEGPAQGWGVIRVQPCDQFAELIRECPGSGTAATRT